MEERPPFSLAEELLPRPLSRLRFSPASPSPPPSPPPPPLPSPSLLAPSPAPTQIAAPSWELLGVQRFGSLPNNFAAAAAGTRRVSWGDHHRQLFGEASPSCKVCSPLAPVSSPPPPKLSPRPSPRNAAEPAAAGPGTCDYNDSPCWTWKASIEPDDEALAKLFSRDEQAKGGGDNSGNGAGDTTGCDECVSVCSSGGGWKADFSSHFKPATAAAVPPLARLANATAANAVSPSPSPSPSASPSSTLLPRPLSPKKSPKACASSSPKMPAPPKIRSATPTPRSATHTTKPDQSSAKNRKCVTPDVAAATDRTCSSVCYEDRLMDCSCCNRKDRSHVDVQIGVERELVVEDPAQRRKFSTARLFTGPPERKPPMRFGLAPPMADSVNRAAAMRSAEAKARFTVLPVVTLTKARRLPPEARRERPLSSSRLNPEFRGGWARECSSVLPRPNSCQGHHSRQSHHSHGHEHEHEDHSRGSGPSPAQLDLATPSLNSTARLLEKLEETKREKFDARDVLESDDIRTTRLHHSHGSSPDGEHAERYKDLCKIQSPPSDHPRTPKKKKKKERVPVSNIRKPQMSDLWVPSEQCPQVCSTAPSYWRPDETQNVRADSEREALDQGAQNAMLLYSLPNPFFKND